MTSSDRVIEIGQLLSRALVRLRSEGLNNTASDYADSQNSPTEALDLIGDRERSLHGNNVGGCHE